MASISPEVLLKFGGKLLPGSGLMANTSLVFTRLSVRSEVPGGEEESNAEETGDSEVMAGKGIREDGELDSSTKGGLIHGTFSGCLLMRVVISEYGNS